MDHCARALSVTCIAGAEKIEGGGAESVEAKTRGGALHPIWIEAAEGLDGRDVYGGGGGIPFVQLEIGEVAQHPGMGGVELEDGAPMGASHVRTPIEHGH